MCMYHIVFHPVFNPGLLKKENVSEYCHAQLKRIIRFMLQMFNW